jgi:2,6-dihydroxypseudooxynicotine hydrolase
LNAPTESAETLADRRLVEEGYALANEMWSTKGAVATLKYVHHLPYGRALPLGLDLAEIDRIIASMTCFYREGERDWPTQWFKAGDEYLERAHTAEAVGHQHTATQMLYSAGACYHLAGYMHHDIGRLMPVQQKSMTQAAEIYWQAAPRFSPPAIRISLPFDGVPLPAFLRLPHDLEQPPCVVMIGGANSNKFNLHAVSDYYLERGMATFGLDGPGQGEYRAAGGMPLRVADFDRALRVSIDWLTQDGRINVDRIGIYGRATGGLLAIHASAHDKRIKAVVAHPASFNWTNFFERNFVPTLVTHRLELCNLFGAKTLAEGTRLVHEQLTLEHVAGRVTCPILTVCSADDETMPSSESELLSRRVNAPVEVITFPGKGHGGPSRLSLPLEADWLHDKLTKPK